MHDLPTRERLKLGAGAESRFITLIVLPSSFWTSISCPLAATVTAASSERASSYAARMRLCRMRKDALTLVNAAPAFATASASRLARQSIEETGKSSDFVRTPIVWRAPCEGIQVVFSRAWDTEASESRMLKIMFQMRARLRMAAVPLARPSWRVLRMPRQSVTTDGQSGQSDSTT